MSLLIAFVALLLHIDAVNNIDSGLIDGSNEFGYDLSNVLYQDSSTNIWISPFCITSCFSLIYPGSNGNTRTQIQNVMGYPTDSDVAQQFFILQSLIENTYNGERGTEENHVSIIKIANKIYSSSSLSLKQTYIDALNDGTESFIDYDFDFTANNATTIINEWVNDNTNGLIDNIIPETQDISNWRLAALNAIYLNGTFAMQFESEMTSLNKFYMNGLRETEISNCHLMHQYDFFQYYKNDDYQFLKFDFSDSNNNLFVLFALPINNQLYNNKNALITDNELIETAINNLKETYIALALPKISIEATYFLNAPLIDLGISDAFTQNADFSGISDEALFIDTVIHKTMIEMDEKGLVAAAVTLISMDESARELPTPILFKADHSYQMFIIDGEHDNTILFMGQINDPGIPKGSNQPIYDESTDSIWNNFELYHSNNNAMSANPKHILSIYFIIIVASFFVLPF